VGFACSLLTRSVPLVKSVFSRFFRQLTAGALVVAMAAWAVLLIGGAANAQPVTSGSLAFSGDQGDYISGGRSYTYSTAANDSLNVNSNGNGITISVNGAKGDWWTLGLSAPSGQTLVPGVYNAATRAAFKAPTVPGLELSGNGRGCNTLTGSFAIQNVVFGPDNYVEKFDATYEQHCEGGTPALRGEVHITNAPPPSPPPNPSPPPSPTPSPSPSPSGSFAFSGDQGDYISGGRFYSYSTAANDSLNLTSNGNHITVDVRGANSDWWTLNLSAPSGQTLAPGAYNGATRDAFKAPTAPGLELSGTDAAVTP
jgi:hypothetical protein